MPTETRPLPSHIGRFRVEALLGSGGMGDVYRAVDPTLQRMVAVKTVRPNIEKPEYLARLYREAQACARLQHPHIVTVHEAGEVDGVVYIAMEYLKGRDLAKVLKEGTLSFEERIRILNEVLEALEHAHGENVIHRDIKPSNVYVLPNGAIKLVDFGLARMEHADALTVVGTTLGTPHYASPEQLAGDATVDLRTDIYSVGVLTYELFTGRRPFQRGEDDSLAKLIMRVLSEAPPPMNVVWTRRYPDLERIVVRAMAKDPVDRYQSAADMRASLTALLSTPPIDVPDSAPADSATVLIDPSVDADTRVASVAPTTMRATTPMVATKLASASSAPTTLHAPRGQSAEMTAPPPAARSGLRRAWPWMAGVGAMMLAGILVNSQVNSGGAAEPTATSAALSTDAPAASAPPAPAIGPVAPAPTPASGPAASGTSTAPAMPTTPAATNTPAATPVATVPGTPADAAHALSAVQMFDRPATVAGGAAGLRYRVLQRALDGSAMAVDPGTRFRTGDRVRLSLESNSDGYLYIVERGSSGKWFVLFPDADINGGQNLVRAGQPHVIPNGDGWLKFDGPPGTEDLFVYFSKEPTDAMKLLPSSNGEAPPAVVTKLQQTIKSRDLVFEKTPRDQKAPASPASQATYVANPGTAVAASIPLVHGQ